RKWRLLLVKTATAFSVAVAGFGLRALPARRRVARPERPHVVEARRAIAAGPAPSSASLGLRDLDGRGRQFVEKSRRDRGCPGPVDAAAGGEEGFCAPPGARQPDMREAALLLQTCAALLVERALAGKQAFLPAGQEHGVEFEPFGRMQRHQ